MRYLIASDVHGSADAAERLAALCETMGADRLVLLGDLLYHGPRNPLPQGYDPKTVAAVLNGLPVPVTAVRGNCDAEVDQMMLGFPCLDTSALIVDGGTTLFATHGHVHSPQEHPALAAGSVFLSGHSHIKTLDEREGILYVNPGSPTLPKDDRASFAFFDGETFSLRDFAEGTVLAEKRWPDESR